MPIFRIHHVTKYSYNKPVKESMNEVRIFPFQCSEQEVLQHDLVITDQPDMLTFTDYWGNKTGFFNILLPHSTLTIESRLLVRATASSQLKINFHSGFEDLRQEIDNNLQLLELARPEMIASQQEIDEIVSRIHKPEGEVAALVERCSEYIFKNFKYIKGITNVETTVDEILVHRAGVCQDFAHLMLHVLRTIGIPSRYVSGYICPNKNGMRGEGATHAWVEAYIPGFGWAGIDPTNNVWVTNKHIKLSVGRNFLDCSPVKGTFKGAGTQTLSVYVSVGYEDGNLFEELNNVQLAGDKEPREDALEGAFAGQ